MIEIVKSDEITEENPDFACIIKQQERLKADMLEYIARNGDTKMTKIIRKSLYDYKHLKKESTNINLRAHNESSGPKPNKKKRKK